MPDLAFRLPATPGSIALARHELDRLAGEVDAEQLDVLRLLVSETVSNSVRHAGAAEVIDIRLWLGRRSIRLEVEDRGPGFRPRRVSRTNGGWGLVIVERLARRWGGRSGRPTTVWLELDRQPSTA